MKQAWWHTPVILGLRHRPLRTSAQTCAHINMQVIWSLKTSSGSSAATDLEYLGLCQNSNKSHPCGFNCSTPPVHANSSVWSRFDWLGAYWSRIDHNSAKWSMSPTIPALKSGGRDKRILSKRKRREEGAEGRRKQACRHRRSLALWRSRWSSVRNEHETRWSIYKQGQAWLNPSCSLHREPALPTSIWATSLQNYVSFCCFCHPLCGTETQDTYTNAFFD